MLIGKDYDRLIEVLSVQTNSENEKLMVLYLDKVLRSMKLDYMIDSAGNILVVKGKADTYPCVVSHMDTVHDFVQGFHVVEQDVNYVGKKDKKFIRSDTELRAFDGDGKRVGVGGDDKCGVYACLYYLKYLPAVKVVFFSREEAGCRGSGKVNHDFFKDCRYMIQLDRRGKEDFITNYWGEQTVSHKFKSDIGAVKKKYGYKKGTGTVTDSVKLWDAGVDISCCNISCGYYNAHSSKEYISLPEFENSIAFIKEVIETMPNRMYKHKKPKEKAWTTTYTTPKANKKQCSGCLVWKSEITLYKLDGRVYCWECLKKRQKPTHEDTPTTTSITKPLTYKCHECKCEIGAGVGKIFRMLNGNLYCNDCVALFNLDYTGEQRDCNICGCTITNEEWDCKVNGELVCEYCYLEGDKDTPPNDIRMCWVCGHVISKTQKILLRFEEEVCEGCYKRVVNHG